MVTKTRKLKDFDNKETSYDSSSYSGRSTTFKIPCLGENCSIRFEENKDPELYAEYQNRKNINVNLEDKGYSREDVMKLKKKFFARYDIPTQEEYDTAAEKCRQARIKEHDAYVIGDLARMITYDLAVAYEADKSGKRYKEVVEYAKNVLNAIAEDKPYKDLKEPNRGIVGGMMDRISGNDSLVFTKRHLGEFFDKDSFERNREAFREMSKNIPEEPMTSRVIGTKGDRVVTKFMNIYDNKALAARREDDKAVNEFIVLHIKREIVRAAEYTLDVKIKAHNNAIREQREEDKKKTKPGRVKDRQKVVQRMRTSISTRGKSSDRSK